MDGAGGNHNDSRSEVVSVVMMTMMTMMMPTTL